MGNIPCLVSEGTPERRPRARPMERAARSYHGIIGQFNLYHNYPIYLAFAFEPALSWNKWAKYPCFGGYLHLSHHGRIGQTGTCHNHSISLVFHPRRALSWNKWAKYPCFCSAGYLHLSHHGRIGQTRVSHKCL